jgi:GT2 family glycosyltransferase
MLDEEFSPYGSEDIDFCARVTRAGWKIRYVPKAHCWHRPGGSFRENYERTYFNARNLLLLARKNLSMAYFWLLFLPDFVFVTAPLILINSYVQKQKKRRHAFINAIKWNIKDIDDRGLLLRSRPRNCQRR